MLVHHLRDGYHIIDIHTDIYKSADELGLNPMKNGGSLTQPQRHGIEQKRHFLAPERRLILHMYSQPELYIRADMSSFDNNFARLI